MRSFQCKKAITYFKKAQKLEPDNVEIEELLNFTRILSNDPEFYKTILKQNKNN